MFRRPHHRKVAHVLQAMDAELLRRAKCYFGGGTAIAMLLDEYRESVDIDFLCADQEGYRMLRGSVFKRGLEELFVTKVEALRDVRADRDGIRAVLAVEGIPIKFKVVREARIGLDGTDVPKIPVPCLTRVDLFAEKLLANADRFGDRSAMSRDVIDLMMMESSWGPIPDRVWEKACSAYGDSVSGALGKARALLRSDPRYFDACLSKLGIDERSAGELRKALGQGERGPGEPEGGGQCGGRATNGAQIRTGGLSSGAVAGNRAVQREPADHDSQPESANATIRNAHT
jgi:hypothetical protein